ncbi:hypothetical protein BRADI_3g27512v3 [Brachypodium distachyon]|uniref:Uncharacterized protein n=1 Tax=Brachypodium distachyon TaxID=15368 RepID=A0A2K2CZJ3_BRADI|nr:hypothetical protein BRADI_3g27512v3 [Brachypodium distachyon]PNT67449.1 hypothetical protein BRADI_3g27512v3 [Brachypodium distachyon]
MQNLLSAPSLLGPGKIWLSDFPKSPPQVPSDHSTTRIALDFSFLPHGAATLHLRPHAAAHLHRRPHTRPTSTTGHRATTCARPPPPPSFLSTAVRVLPLTAATLPPCRHKSWTTTPPFPLLEVVVRHPNSLRKMNANEAILCFSVSS